MFFFFKYFYISPIKRNGTLQRCLGFFLTFWEHMINVEWGKVQNAIINLMLCSTLERLRESYTSTRLNVIQEKSWKGSAGRREQLKDFHLWSKRACFVYFPLVGSWGRCRSRTQLRASEGRVHPWMGRQLMAGTDLSNLGLLRLARGLLDRARMDQMNENQREG